MEVDCQIQECEPDLADCQGIWERVGADDCQAVCGSGHYETYQWKTTSQATGGGSPCEHAGKTKQIACDNVVCIFSQLIKSHFRDWKNIKDKLQTNIFVCFNLW